MPRNCVMLCSSSTTRIFSPGISVPSLGLRRLRQRGFPPELEGNGGARSGRARDVEPAPEAFGDPRGDGEAETRATALRGEERLQHARLVFGGNAGAVVRDANLHAVPVRGGDAHGDRASTFEGFDRVL